MKKYLKKNAGSLILAIVFAIAYAGAFVGISLLLQEIIDIALIPAIRALTPIWEKIEEYTAVENDEIEVSIPKKDWNRISFEDISFAYPGEEEPVLSDISLSIEKGKKYLIVGESGAGKTTLINMICGNYAPLGGRILFDGKAVESAMETLKRNTAVVWQNVFLFNESIMLLCQ